MTIKLENLRPLEAVCFFATFGDAPPPPPRCGKRPYFSVSFSAPFPKVEILQASSNYLDLLLPKFGFKVLCNFWEACSEKITLTQSLQPKLKAEMMKHDLIMSFWNHCKITSNFISRLQL